MGGVVNVINKIQNSEFSDIRPNSNNVKNILEQIPL